MPKSVREQYSQNLNWNAFSCYAFFVVLPSGYLLFYGLFLSKLHYNRISRWFSTFFANSLAKFRKKPVVQEDKTPDSFTFGSILIDAIQYRIRKGKRVVDLSDRELQLVKYFYSHPNEVLSRDRLLNAVWGIDFFGTTRTLDQHIAQLRKKIEQDPGHPSVITTVHGVGYRYESS